MKIMSSVVHTANMEIRPFVKWSLKEVKNNENYNAVTSKSGRGRLRGWSFTRDSNYRALTGKSLLFWIGDRLWEVVAYERWSPMEVRL